jgi:6,7-dimethyl-8-ribityllumazine synthase
LSSRRVLRRLVPAFSPKELEGDTSAAGLRFAVLCARWNPTVTEALLHAALRTLSRRGARAADVTVVRVPGAFELPAAARTVLEKGRTDALVALGAIVRGQTTHYEVLGHAVATALAGLSADTGLPIGFGVLTCETMEQARERSGKGAEAAEAAIEMANLRRRIRRR